MTTNQVLYRKWRPPRFADIVGQGSITQTLCQAVSTGRVAHAYLFCGPRGTGKTSTARVVGKAINCLGRVEGTCDPDGTCAICTAIDTGSFIDLIEIDAASNRGIDEMRDLREKVRFAPSQGVYKVYIIDEAHALTPDAFNAFLKTLEEPPPNTVFILATTEPHRLPATIVSRCQRFDFRRISTTDVAERISEIAQSEGIDVESEALYSIARAAGGSLRDATNLLDQCITSFGVHLTLEQVRDVLGIAGEERAIALVKHLLTGNTTQALELINATASEGLDLRPMHRTAVDLLRSALLLKSGVHDSLDLSREAQTELGGLAPRVPLEHIIRALRLFGGVSLRHDQPSPLPLELATVELSLEPGPAEVVQAHPSQAPQQLRGQAQQPQTKAPPAKASTERSQIPSQGSVPGRMPAPTAPSAYRPTEVAKAPAENGEEVLPDERLTASWPAILRAASRVPRKRYDVGALLRSSRGHYLEDGILIIRFLHQSNSERLQEELADPLCRLAVEEMLTQILGDSYTVRVETTGSGSTSDSGVDSGHLVRAAVNLGGQVTAEPANDMPAPAEAPLPSEAKPTRPKETTDEMEAAPTQGQPGSVEASTADPTANS